MSDDKIKVIIAMNFSDALLEEIRDVSPRLQVERHYPTVPASAWEDAEVLCTSSQYPEPEQAPLLRWIQLSFAGMERAINHRIVQAEDVVVTSASGIHAQQMANYALMMLLAFNFKLPHMLELKSQATWPKNPYKIFAPVDMNTQTVGIVGYGSIGRELARLANSLGMRVLATKRDVKRPAESPRDYNPPGTGDPNGEIPERIYPGSALAKMAAECDFLVVTTPLTDETHHMVNEAVFNAMKPSAILVNVARGGVVDEKALISALAAEKIGGAALDVFEEEPLPSGSPLWNMDNVIISPHVSGNSSQYDEKVAALFIENLTRYVENRPLLNALDREVGY